MFLEFRPLIIKSATYGSRVGADVRSADEIGISIQPELSQSSSSSGQLNFDRNHRARSGWSGSCRTLFSAFPHFPPVAARATPKRAFELHRRGVHLGACSSEGSGRIDPSCPTLPVPCVREYSE